jgi:hypothetical protein
MRRNGFPWWIFIETLFMQEGKPLNDIFKRRLKATSKVSTS